MLPPRLLLATVLPLIALTAHAQSPAELDEKQFEAIADRPHSDQKRAKGLQIYPKARAYRADVTVTTAADAAGHKFGADATEKTVDGQYIVTEIKLAEGMTITMIVTWDEKADLYYKYVAVPNGPLLKFIGLRAGDTRTLAWTYLAPPGDAKREVLVTEVHSDQKTTWREVHWVDGKIERVQHGEAVVTER